MPDVSAPRPVEATADALARRALDALPATVGRSDLAPLAPPLGRLLEARLAAAVDQATPDSPWVHGDRVDAARAALREAAQDAVRIPEAEREAEVRQAAHRALSHLVRPADTLAAVAFEGQAGPLPVDVVLGRIRAFGPYPYLPQIAERYAERKGLGHIDRPGLERLLRRIDRRMVSTFGADDWLALLAPLVEWVGPAGSPPGSVPASLLRPLFLAKGADELHDALDEVDAVDAETLRELLADVLPAPSETAPEATLETPAAAPPEPPGAQDAEAAPPEPEPPSADDRPRPGADRQSGGEPDDGPPEPEHRPPVIGSRYGSPEFERDPESEVLGPPRPVEGVRPDAGVHEAAPMETVREAVAEPVPTPPAAPPVPVLDLAAPGEPPAPPDEPAQAAEPTAPADGAPGPGPDPDDEPLWMRLARARGAEAPAPAAESDEDTPLWKRFAQSDLAERLPDPEPPAPLAGSPGGPDSTPTGEAPAPRTPLGQLEARVLGPEAEERRDWFVAGLFGGSADEYHRTLDAIDRAPTYTDATAIISADVLRKRSVSPYTDCAVAFIDAVQSGFDQR